MTTAVALLRGINVGGKNKLPMADLSAMFAEAGCTHVSTYIQSGNVVFDASSSVYALLPGAIPARIRKRFSFDAPVVLRTAAELAAVPRKSPYLAAAGDDIRALHVMFLVDLPEKEAIAALDPKRSPGDSFAVVGRDVYLHLPNGVGRTKLTNAYFDAKLATVSTVRNWRTVLELIARSSR